MIRGANVLFIAVLFSSASLVSQPSPNERGEATLRDGEVTLSYGRPLTRGRDVMALITPGRYWRMGADVDTTLTTRTDLQFGASRVPRGSYVLLAHFLGEAKWELVVCKGVGAGFSPQDTIATIPMEYRQGVEETEKLTIVLEERGQESVLVLTWGSHRLSARFSAASESVGM